MSSQNYQTVSSLKSFKEYVSSFVMNDASLVDGWGWYIDIEKCTHKIPMQLSKYHKYGKKISQYIDYKPTLTKISSLPSVSNLNEMYMSDEEYQKKILNQDLIIYINTVGLIGIVAIYYTLFIR